MVMISMILTIKVTVSLFGISHHLVGPYEEGFIFDFFQYLMHWLLEDSFNSLGAI